MNSNKVHIVLDCEDDTIKVYREGSDDKVMCNAYHEFAIAIQHYVRTDPFFIRDMVNEYYLDVKPEGGFKYH